MELMLIITPFQTHRSARDYANSPFCRRQLSSSGAMAKSIYSVIMERRVCICSSDYSWGLKMPFYFQQANYKLHELVGWCSWMFFLSAIHHFFLIAWCQSLTKCLGELQCEFLLANNFRNLSIKFFTNEMSLAGLEFQRKHLPFLGTLNTIVCYFYFVQWSIVREHPKMRRSILDCREPSVGPTTAMTCVIS